MNLSHRLSEALKKVIFALDISDLEKAKELLMKIGPHVGGIKIGLETQTEFGGPVIINLVAGANGKIFYDGKWNDIMKTIENATKALATKKSITMFNVHATSGDAAIQAAVQNCGDAIVLVVTVLTSISPEECYEIFRDTPENVVLKFARKAKRNGAHGVICSAKELPLLMANPDVKDLIKVTPGIQPEWMNSNDQKRVMSPGEAIMAGADYVVIGRAISSPDPKAGWVDAPAKGDSLAALKLIAEEIAQAMDELKAVEGKV